MLELNKIYFEDCLEGMKKIDDKSIDMILCDLPYGTTACSWDSVINLDKFSMHNVGNFHPTQKPIALCEYLIKTYTKNNDLILDNCMGSATTAVACKNLNRNFIGFENNEEYYKIACERINQNVQ